MNFELEERMLFAVDLAVLEVSGDFFHIVNSDVANLFELWEHEIWECLVHKTKFSFHIDIRMTSTTSKTSIAPLNLRIPFRMPWPMNLMHLARLMFLLALIVF